MRLRRKATAPIDTDAHEEAPVALSPTDGPFDADEVNWDDRAPTEESRLDLGALLLPAPPEGFEVHLQADPESGAIAHLMVAGPDSGLELSASARGRTTPAWADHLREVSAQVAHAGGTATPADGPMGSELVCRIPITTPDGRAATQMMRAIGFEGPRWLLVGMLHGRAAFEEDAAASLRRLFTSVVVRRGRGAMLHGETLPLRMPVEGAGPAGQATQQSTGGQ